jgi:hypothetical protein
VIFEQKFGKGEIKKHPKPILIEDESILMLSNGLRMFSTTVSFLLINRRTILKFPFSGQNYHNICVYDSNDWHPKGTNELSLHSTYLYIIIMHFSDLHVSEILFMIGFEMKSSIFESSLYFFI